MLMTFGFRHASVVYSKMAGGYAAPFVEALDKDLECPICLCALRDPVQTECGHLFCRGCFEETAK